jgi:hypothetical protein
MSPWKWITALCTDSFSFCKSNTGLPPESDQSNPRSHTTSLTAAFTLTTNLRLTLNSLYVLPAKCMHSQLPQSCYTFCVSYCWLDHPNIWGTLQTTSILNTCHLFHHPVTLSLLHPNILDLWNLQFSRQWILTLKSSCMWYSVLWYIDADVSEEHADPTVWLSIYQSTGRHIIEYWYVWSWPFTSIYCRGQ